MIIVLYGPPRPTPVSKNVRKKLFLAKHIVSALLTQKLQKSGTHSPAPVHQIVHECHGSGVCLPTVTQGNMTYILFSYISESFKNLNSTLSAKGQKDLFRNWSHLPQRALNLKSCVLPIFLQEPLKHL